MLACLKWFGAMSDLDSAYVPDSTTPHWGIKPVPYDDPCCLVYETDMPSHETWAQFVDNCNAHGMEGLTAIVNKMKQQYGAQFHITTEAWWFEFPDPDTRLLFVLTWL